MDEKPEKKFVEGMRFEKPREGAPEFVKGRISVHLLDFTTWAEQYVNERGWLNIDLKKSKSGTLYLELNDFKPKTAKTETDEEDGSPF